MPNKKNENVRDQELFTVFIETLTGTTFEIKLSPQDRVRSIKCKIQRVEGIPISHQHLLYNLKELKDSSCVTDPSVALHDQATLKLVLSMRGGPISLVHQTIPFSRSTLRSLIKLNRREDTVDDSSGCKMAVLVLRVGDQLNLLHVVEDCDGPETRESWSSGRENSSFDNLLDGETCKSSEENSRTMEKVCDLKEKMEKLALQRKSHETNTKRVKKEKESNSNVTSKKPSCSLRLPSIHRDVKEDMFKSRSEFSQIPILPDIIAQCGKSTPKEPDFIDVNEETNAFDVHESVRPKTCPSSLCESECYNIIDEVQCEKTLEIRHPHFRSCVSACTTKLQHEWGGRKSLLQSLNIPPPMEAMTDVFNNHRRASTSGINSVTTSVPSVENLNFDNRLMRSSFKSRHTVKKEDINSKKKEVRKKKAASLNSENNNYPETTFTLWDSNSVYSPFATSKAFSGSSSRSSFCEILENSSNSDLVHSSVTSKLEFDKKHRLRCSECKKKLSLTTNFECRCGLIFCSLHRYSETHNCSFDFKKDSRKILEQANPSVVAPKLPKI